MNFEKLEEFFSKYDKQFEQERRERFEISPKFRAFLDYKFHSKSRDKVFELLIYEYLSYGGSPTDEYFLALDVKLLSPDSHSLRQLDIVRYRSSSEGGDAELVDVIECRDHARPIGAPQVEQFYGKLKGLRAPQGTIYSPRGFTRPATNSARANSIELVTLHWLDLLTELWYRNMNFILCLSCRQEDYEYRPSAVTWGSGDIDQIRFGYCHACHTTHLACMDCDNIFAVESEPPVTLACSGCGSMYFFGRSGYGKDVRDDPVVYIWPAMATCLESIRDSAEGRDYSALVGELAKFSSSAQEPHSQLDIAFGNAWIEDEDELCVLGSVGRKIMVNVRPL